MTGTRTRCENGSYRKVLGRWSLDAEAIDRSLTNPPGLPRT